MRGTELQWRVVNRFLDSPSGEGSVFFGAAILSQALVALFYIQAARNASPPALGAAASVVAVSAWVVALVDFGNTSLVLREIAGNRMTGREMHQLLTGRVVVLLVLWIPAVLATVVAATPLIAMVAAMASVRLVLQTTSAALRARRRKALPAGLSVLEPSVAILMFAFLPIARPELRITAALLMGMAASLAVAWGATVHEFGKPTRSLKHNWAASRHLGVFSLAVTASDLDVPIASLSGSAGYAGEFAAVSRWTRPTVVLTGAFLQMAGPRMAGASSGREAWRSVRSASWLLWLALGASVGLAIIGPQLITVMLGAAYAGSASALVVLSVAAAVTVPTQVLAHFLIQRRHDRAVSRIMVATTAFQLLLVVPMAQEFGALGLATATLASKLASLGLLAGLAARLRSRSGA